MKAVAITAVGNNLIGHYFESEEDALKKLPFIKSWTRETWDKRHIRYHSKSAKKYWMNRRPLDKINSTAFYYAKGKLIKIEYQ